MNFHRWFQTVSYDLWTRSQKTVFQLCDLNPRAWSCVHYACSYWLYSLKNCNQQEKARRTIEWLPFFLLCWSLLLAVGQNFIT